MKHTLLALAFAAFAFLASAADKIEGAVGVKLGEQFPAHIAIKTNRFNDVDRPRFFPTNAVPPFTGYTARLHPLSKKVMAIAAEAEVENVSVEWEKLHLLLTRKYGKPAKVDRDKNLHALWRSEDRYIELAGFMGGQPFVSIVYLDETLSRKAHEDVAAEKAKGINTSGL